MGLLFALVLLCLPLAVAVWDLSRSGRLLPSRQRDAEHRETDGAGATREEAPATNNAQPMASPSR